MHKLMKEAEINMGEAAMITFDRLPDPLGDRVVKEVPLPPMRPIGLV